MKKLKDIEKINSNKAQLIEYLNDFTDLKRDEVLQEFKEEDYNCGYYVFKSAMRSKISMPKFGKSTLIYWTSRGWSVQESTNKRVKILKNPESSPMNIFFWIKKGYTNEEAIFKIRSQRKLNIEYWINRGFSIEIAEEMRREYQKTQSLKLSKKRKETPEKYDCICNNQIKYWTNQGYSEEDAIKFVSKRQSTFSKDICVSKHGIEMGEFIWKKRQEKWLNSLAKSHYNLSDGKSIPMKYKVENYDIDDLVNSLSLKNKEIFKILLKKCESIDDFINEYVKYFESDDEITLYKIVKPIYKLKILHDYYNTNNEYILSLLIPKITRVKSKYSYYTWFNGHICRSDGEYIIANFLFKNNLKYKYEKKYEFSKLKCDFYLTDYSIYIEYMGMKSNMYDSKIDFIKKNNINCILSDNINDIKIKILEYVNNKNR